MTCVVLRYQRECAELSQWLQSALERLEFWNTQAVLVPQELETVRDHLAAFLVRPHLLSFLISVDLDAHNSVLTWDFFLNTTYSTAGFS